MRLVITGSAGFVGSEVVRHNINNTNHSTVNSDVFWYSRNTNHLFTSLPLCLKACQACKMA